MNKRQTIRSSGTKRKSGGIRKTCFGFCFFGLLCLNSLKWVSTFMVVVGIFVGVCVAVV